MFSFPTNLDSACHTHISFSFQEQIAATPIAWDELASKPLSIFSLPAYPQSPVDHRKQLDLFKIRPFTCIFIFHFLRQPTWEEDKHKVVNWADLSPFNYGNEMNLYYNDDRL